MSEIIDLQTEMEEEQQERDLEPSQNEDSVSGLNSKIKIGILGSGPIANSVRVLFSTREADTEIFEDVDSCINWQPNISFICLPTVLDHKDAVDDLAIINAVQKLILHSTGGIALKSAVSPDTISRINSAIDNEAFLNRFCYNPEVYDSEDVESIINPELVLVGGFPKSAAALVDVYQKYSNLIIRDVEVCNPLEAAFVKLAISGYRAVKQTFFNQLYEFASEYDNINWSSVRTTFSRRDLNKELTTTIPSFIRAKGELDLSNKEAKSHKGEYLNRDVKIFAALTDQIPLIDECVNFKNLKD